MADAVSPTPVPPNPVPPRAVVLLSGGLDSTTCLAVARRDGFDVLALSFRYGQRHAHEIDAARRIARAAGVARHVVVDIDLRTFGGSALTADIAVPKDRPLDPSDGPTSGPDASGPDTSAIPITYVPARNTIFLSYALALAETGGAGDIFIGVSAVDYSGYPDCRPAYVDAFQRMANLATRAGVEAAAHGDVALRLRTPLLHLSKADTIRLGASLGVDYAETTSCYDPVSGRDGPDGADGWLACGHCDACVLRRKGFEEAGVPDPTRYAPGA